MRLTCRLILDLFLGLVKSGLESFGMIRRDSGIEEVEADFGTLLKAKTKVNNFQIKTT